MTELQSAINYALAFSMKVLSLVPHRHIGVDAICSDFIVSAEHALCVKHIVASHGHYDTTTEPNGDLHIWQVDNSSYIYNGFTGNFPDWMKRCLSICPDVAIPFDPPDW